MVGVVDALLFDLRTADVGAVVARAGDDGADRAVRADHVDLLGTRPLRDENLTGNADLRAVGRNGVARVAARILDDLVHADGLAVRDEDGRAAVLERERRHEVVHLQQHILVQPDDGRHALAHGHAAPRLAVQRHELPVAELAPLVRVDLAEGKFRRLEIQIPESAAAAVRLARGDGFDVAAFAAYKLHGSFLLFVGKL